MDDDRKSRTQKKNEARALQKLGEQLVALSSEQLDRMLLKISGSVTIKRSLPLKRLKNGGMNLRKETECLLRRF